MRLILGLMLFAGATYLPPYINHILDHSMWYAKPTMVVAVLIAAVLVISGFITILGGCEEEEKIRKPSNPPSML